VVVAVVEEREGDLEIWREKEGGKGWRLER